MALNKLTNETMVDLTSTLVESGHPERVAFMSERELEPLTVRVELAHQALLDARESAIVLALAPISTAQSTIDHRHDWLARAMDSGLAMYIALARARDEHELVTRLEHLQQALFPNGLEVVNLSYRDEAGHGKFLRSSLTPEATSQLESLTIAGSNLHEVTMEWITAALELGELENQRDALAARGHNSKMARARGAWTRIIRLIRHNVAELEIANPTVHETLDRIARAERAAELRSLRRRAAADGEEPAGEEPSGEEPSGEEPASDEPTAGDPAVEASFDISNDRFLIE